LAQVAIRAENLDSLADALRARAGALDASALPSLGVFEAGKKIAPELAALKQRLALENARLEQMRVGLTRAMQIRTPRCVDYFG